MLQGLQNLGNTCCINTLVQCIGHCSLLRTWLLSEQPHQIQNRQDHQLYLSIELARIIHEMWVEHKSLAPALFLKSIYSSLQGMIQRGEQLDLSELWMLVVDRINTEIGRPAACPQIGGNPTDIGAFTTSWEAHNRACMSGWLQTVQGWTVTQIRCGNCGHEDKRFEPFCSLGLDVHDAGGSFQNMFDSMFRGEALSERACDHCKASCSATRQTSMCMYPKVLVLYFKRFEMTPEGHMKKIGAPVDIPPRLRFSGTMTYALSSIGCHLGGLQGGHYYAVAQNQDQKWCIYDDLQLTPVEDISTVLKNNRDAYTLFYEMV